ncbi:MAG TPA: hypothetical protein VMT82_11040 [candidate division Zixibacteria bacterium]|nr:hypothetical protein [candidate division Zixibacteria bacterium]
MAIKKLTAPAPKRPTAAQQLSDLQAQLRAMEASFNQRLAALESKLAVAAVPAPAAAPARPAPEEHEVTPEILAVIAVAVTTFLGKKVRIHSARPMSGPGVNYWAQQGRVFIQASHNLVQTSHTIGR